MVGEDNKAVLFVALDRKDKDYFACDAGCLDQPVELGIQRQQFPIKITEPTTSILYITSDRKHAEELHLSIHVKEIFEGSNLLLHYNKMFIIGIYNSINLIVSVFQHLLMSITSFQCTNMDPVIAQCPPCFGCFCRCSLFFFIYSYFI